MKNRILLVIFGLSFMFSNDINAQKFPKLDKSPMDASTYPSSYRESNKLIKVIYSRPLLKDRSLEKLAPLGKVWRTGANEAVEITFYKDALFGNKEVKAGKYTLFTIPNKDKWTIILNTAENIWGSYYYKKTEDVARVEAKVSDNKKNIEAFSIVFEGEGNNIVMYLGWGKTIVSLPIKIKEIKK